jgi:DNA-binding response OmpR family regulator
MTDTRFVLVVEDDPILKNLLGHTFAGKYQTLYAADGQQALDLFEANKPAAVVKGARTHNLKNISWTCRAAR